MAPSGSLMTVASGTSIQIVEDSSESLGDFYLLDDVFKLRAADKIQNPLIAFPKSDRAVAEFEYFTGQDIDRFIDMAAKHYQEAKLRAVSFPDIVFMIRIYANYKYRMT